MVAQRKAPPRFNGFTLVELLTVIAIIAILATLLASGLSGAKRRARQAACISNLHQISLALNLYLDDEVHRPANLTSLVSQRYLPNPRALLCPEDKTGNWGGLIEGSTNSIVQNVVTGNAPDVKGLIPDPGPKYSYLHPLPWEDSNWDKLMKKESSAGLATCQVHGIGKPNLDAPSIYNYEGLILRAQRDGAVVRRQIYWAQAPNTGRNDGISSSLVSGPTLAPGSNSSTNTSWPLFADDLPQ
jgi:prepilin-type N-terminal cleavage/methylation domain-containing protein